MLTLVKKLKSRRGNGYCFVAKGETFSNETIRLVVRTSGLWEAYTPNLPQMGQNIYHGMLIPLHDSMLSFMNFGRVLDLLELKNHVFQCLQPSESGKGPKHATKDTYLIFQPIYMHWSMRM